VAALYAEGGEKPVVTGTSASASGGRVRVDCFRKSRDLRHEKCSATCFTPALRRNTRTGGLRQGYEKLTTLYTTTGCRATIRDGHQLEPALAYLMAKLRSASTSSHRAPSTGTTTSSRTNSPSSTRGRVNHRHFKAHADACVTTSTRPRSASRRWTFRDAAKDLNPVPPHLRSRRSRGGGARAAGSRSRTPREGILPAHPPAPGGTEPGTENGPTHADEDLCFSSGPRTHNPFCRSGRGSAHHVHEGAVLHPADRDKI